MSRNAVDVFFFQAEDGIRDDLVTGVSDVCSSDLQMKLRAGKFADQKPANGCFLPPLPRSIIASQQNAGTAIAQDLASGAQPRTFEQSLQALPADQRAQLTAPLAPLDQAIRAHPGHQISPLPPTPPLSTPRL